jgi:hypothetical protein
MKRYACFLAGILAVGLFATPALAQYPSTPQVEFATATW